MKYKIGRILGLAALSALSVGLIVGNVYCFKVLGVDFINNALSGSGASSGDEESAQKGAKLVKKITEDGTVLLKNDNSTLPLDTSTNNKVNVFGFSSTDKGWVYTGVGSGSCLPDPEKRVGIISGLTNAGFETNTELTKKYEEAIPSSDNWFGYDNYGKIIQPANDFYSDSLISQAKSFSDTAIVVLSRISGENTGEIPETQVDYMSGETDTTRSYLEISAKEEYMLNVVEDSFDKVIVLLNTTNNMECGFLKDDKIDAAMYVGPTGLCGTESIGNLLAGRKIDETTKEETKISPSGKLADTYSADYTAEPSYGNKGVRNQTTTGGNIVYQEGIYFGYRWYETADAEGFFDGLDNGYDSAVIYPFGYGLSYTSFDWKIKSTTLTDGSSLAKDSEIKVTVTVTNSGEYAGKDVVELYYLPPYTKGGIEKSYLSLGDYAKTSVLQPGESQDVELSLTSYDMASYDDYDKNNNGNAGYELDSGDYTLQFRSNAHSPKSMVGGNSLTYKVADTIKITEDPVTGYTVKNRFTGDDAYAWMPIDGSSVGINETYLSRNNFIQTFKDTQSKLPTDTTAVANSKTFQSSAQNQDTMPTFGANNGLYLVTKKDGAKASASDLTKPDNLIYNDTLVDELMSDYNGEKWDQLLDELTIDEATTVVERSGFGTDAVESIGKPKTLDFDGPSGFNQNTSKIAEDHSSWTSYPCEEVIGCTWNEASAYEIGQSMAFEASKSGINGWYAPGVNLHRSNYNGRNYEYYSEDPIISGKMASATIKGAKSGGLYAYIKHFVVSEEGTNPKGVDTWLTEQSLRELYLKPFEMAVKSGANGLMTAFNCLGSVWCGASYDLCTEVLRNEWGFKGSVITDWSSGDSIMNPTRGVIAGNDLWLDPMSVNYAPLDKTDPTSMYCAKQAVKHNIYTYISTYQYSRDYQEDDNEYQVTAGIKGPGSISGWWIPTLISIDCVIFAGTIFMGLYSFLPFFNKPKKLKEKKSV